MNISFEEHNAIHIESILVFDCRNCICRCLGLGGGRRKSSTFNVPDSCLTLIF